MTKEMAFSWFNIISVLAILCFHELPTHPDRFRDQACFAMLFTWGCWSALISNQIQTKILFPILLWLGYSAIRVFAAKYSPYKSMAMWFDGPSAVSLLWITLTVTLLSVGLSRGILFEFYKIAALINSAFLILHLPGILDNPAEDATLVACISPLILFSQEKSFADRAAKLILVLGILASKSATGIFALIAMVISYAWLTRRTKIALGSIFILALGVGMQGRDLISSNGRYSVWEMTWKWWVENASWMIGTGLGTFEVLGPGIQRRHGASSQFFLFAHNEWFQILFETGIVGFILTLGIYFYGLFRTKDLSLRLCWIVLGVISLSQSPFRVALLGIWSALLCLEMISRDNQ